MLKKDLQTIFILVLIAAIGFFGHYVVYGNDNTIKFSFDVLDVKVINSEFYVEGYTNFNHNKEYRLLKIIGTKKEAPLDICDRLLSSDTHWVLEVNKDCYVVGAERYYLERR